MNATEARAAVANARRNEDGTVTLHAVEDGGHVYPYPAETIHVKPSEAIELLQYEPAAYTLDHHTREDGGPRKPRNRSKGGVVKPVRATVGDRGPETFIPPEAPAAAPEQPEGPSDQDGSSDSMEVAP